MNYKIILPILAFTAAAHAGGISVGSSSLIQTLDYSDTFTLGVGTRTTLPANHYNIGNGFPGALALENNYGNPARTWTDFAWSISQDAVAINGATPFPGGSGAGSATGMTQTGGGEVNFGIEYDLRNDFVVQLDAVQVSDRVNITIGNGRDTIAQGNGLSVFFRQNAHAILPEVGVYNPNVGELITSLDTGLAGVDLNEWHNYAVRFDLNNNDLTIWVDQIQLGILDLDTLGGPTVFGGPVVLPGAYVPFLNAATNDSVTVGTTGGDRTWTDNFQVGSPVPEPGSATMLMLGAIALGLRRRR